jgi:hypothetical protein
MKIVILLGLLLVLTGATDDITNNEATFYVWNGDLYLQTPSFSGTFFINGMDVVEALRKAILLEDQVAMISQENKNLKVCSPTVLMFDVVVLTQKELFSCRIGGKCSASQSYAGRARSTDGLLLYMTAFP